MLSLMLLMDFLFARLLGRPARPGSGASAMNPSHRTAPLGLILLALLGLACRSPLADLPLDRSRPALQLAVQMEDHSHRLSQLWSGSEANSPEARSQALERHRATFEADLRREAAARGLALDPAVGLSLDLKVSSLGEVRAKYIALGILSGVAWGVGTGLIAHNPRLALGLGAYELVEESAFWIGGSLLMGRWSSPAVVEAQLRRRGVEKPLWEETYYVLWARQELAEYPKSDQERREVQLQASLHKVRKELFKDLEAMPEFPRGHVLSREQRAPAAAQ